MENEEYHPHAVENPKVGQQYWVQCKDYRCMATLEDNGDWISQSTGKKMDGVLKVYPA
jgi:predicted AlkP superfamily phosphohydrolase/phosphomutase